MRWTMGSTFVTPPDLSNPTALILLHFEKCVMDTKETKQPVIFWADDDPDDLQVMKEVLKTFDQAITNLEYCVVYQAVADMQSKLHMLGLLGLN